MPNESTPEITRKVLLEHWQGALRRAGILPRVMAAASLMDEDLPIMTLGVGVSTKLADGSVRRHAIEIPSRRGMSLERLDQNLDGAAKLVGQWLDGL